MIYFFEGEIFLSLIFFFKGEIFLSLIYFFKGEIFSPLINSVRDTQLPLSTETTLITQWRAMDIITSNQIVSTASHYISHWSRHHGIKSWSSPALNIRKYLDKFIYIKTNQILNILKIIDGLSTRVTVTSNRKFFVSWNLNNGKSCLDNSLFRKLSFKFF